MRRCKEMFEQSEYYLNENYEYKNQMNELFYYVSIEEIERLFARHNLKIEHMISMDGISQFIGDQINELSKEGYERFMEHHLRNCERNELLGYCPHILCVVKNIK